MLQEIETQQIRKWILNPSSQNSENLASKSHETKRIPDPYIFLLINGKVVSPSDLKPIEESILVRDAIEAAEFSGFQEIQRLVLENDHGTVFWFSPPSIDGYSSFKIVVSTIFTGIEGMKGIFNRAIVLDVNQKISLEIASQISRIKFSDSEELRKKPILLEDSESDAWLEILAKYSEQANLIVSGQDVIAKVETLSQTDIIYTSVSTHHSAEILAIQNGMIGSRKDSCDRSSAFGKMFDNALKSYFLCPKCDYKIPSGKGITKCPGCGITKEEVGSNCD